MTIDSINAQLALVAPLIGAGENDDKSDIINRYILPLTNFYNSRGVTVIFPEASAGNRCFASALYFILNCQNEFKIIRENNACTPTCIDEPCTKCIKFFRYKFDEIKSSPKYWLDKYYKESDFLNTTFPIGETDIPALEKNNPNLIFHLFSGPIKGGAYKYYSTKISPHHSANRKSIQIIPIYLLSIVDEHTLTTPDHYLPINNIHKFLRHRKRGVIKVG